MLQERTGTAWPLTKTFALLHYSLKYHGSRMSREMNAEIERIVGLHSLNSQLSPEAGKWVLCQPLEVPWIAAKWKRCGSKQGQSTSRGYQQYGIVGAHLYYSYRDYWVTNCSGKRERRWKCLKFNWEFLYSWYLISTASRIEIDLRRHIQWLYTPPLRAVITYIYAFSVANLRKVPVSLRTICLSYSQEIRPYANCIPFSSCSFTNRMGLIFPRF